MITSFFKNFFLASGIVWVLSAIAILGFELSFGTKEIVITLIFSLAYAIIRLFEKPAQSIKIGE